MDIDPNNALMTGRARYPSLEGRVVFVTGGASGIGASVVEHFCDQGSRVAFVDVRSDLAEALASDIVARGLPRPWYRECDLRAAWPVGKMIDRLSRKLRFLSFTQSSQRLLLLAR